jgi:MAP/microtubule affinity-regulating kinase
LVDFGLGNTWQKEVKLQTFCGSPYYAAPEMIAATPYIGPEVDVWSLGIMIYAMVSGHLPFDASCIKQLYNLIITGNYTIPQSFSAGIFIVLTVELTRLISKMLKVNPAARCTVHEIAKDA